MTPMSQELTGSPLAFADLDKAPDRRKLNNVDNQDDRDDLDLNAKIATAVAAAQLSRARSYSPYSNFEMGAAVIGSRGETSLGTLIENVSLGLAMCSERVALFGAITQGIKPVVLALCSPRTNGELTFPCGACLQVALELAGPDLIVVVVDPDGAQGQGSLGDLLPRGPHRFTPDTVAGA